MSGPRGSWRFFSATSTMAGVMTNHSEEAEMPKFQKFVLTVVVVSAPFIASAEALAMGGSNHSETLLLDG